MMMREFSGILITWLDPSSGRIGTTDFCISVMDSDKKGPLAKGECKWSEKICLCGIWQSINDSGEKFQQKKNVIFIY